MVNPANISALFGTSNVSNKRALSAHIGDVLNVKSYGATGNPATTTPTAERIAIQNCLDAAFGSFDDYHGSALGANPMVFFPGGEYVIDGPIKVWCVHGGFIGGSGKYSTTIRSTSPSSYVFEASESVRHFQLSNFGLVSPGGVGSSCLYITRHHTEVVFPGSPSCSNITVENCAFEGADIGAYMGQEFPESAGQSQTSEIIFLNCDWLNCTWGVFPATANVLNLIFFGGSFTDCDIGIKDSFFPYICGVLFRNNGRDLDYAANASSIILGCHSTSQYFHSAPSSDDMRYIGCFHDGAVPATFVAGHHRVVFDVCHSTHGTVATGGDSFWARFYFRGSRFGNASFLGTGTVVLPGATSDPGYVIG